MMLLSLLSIGCFLAALLAHFLPKRHRWLVWVLIATGWTLLTLVWTLPRS